MPGGGRWKGERAWVLILTGRHWMPPVSPRSGEGTRRPIRRGEPTGLVPRGAGGQGRLQAAVDGGRAPSLEFLLTRKKMLPSTREWAGRGAPGGPDGREFTVLSKTKKKHRI